MKKIALQGPSGRGKFALVDDEDFERANKLKWWFTHGYAVNKTYIQGTDVKGGKSKTTTLYLHRFILNTPKNIKVDHKNKNGEIGGLDCRKINLRECTQAENVRNQRKTRGSSKYKGVSKRKGNHLLKFEAYIGLKSKKINLGLYENEEGAARAYDKKALELFGEFAKLNFKNN